MTCLRAVGLFALLALTAQGAKAAAYRDVQVAVPRTPLANEDVALRVKAGVLRRGVEVDVYDMQGTLLGTVSPFAIRSGQEAGTYTIPLNGRLGHGRSLAVRLVLTDAGHPPRAPTLREVRGVTAVFVSDTP